MTILYITEMNYSANCGPVYSVPAQIKAQSVTDDVYWVDFDMRERNEWEKLGYYHKADNYRSFSPERLPPPFNKPDLAVFENFYHYKEAFVAGRLVKRGIPYIIIPRSSLTARAQERKKLKKAVGNFFIFNSFAKRAAAIQYLSENEHISSGDRWNKKCFVIPNGIDMHEQNRLSGNIPKRFTFIGRYDVDQKGLDLLFSALRENMDKFRYNGAKVYLYGQRREKDLQDIIKLISDNGLEDIVAVNGPVYGKDKEDILKQTDIFVMTSRFEGFSMGLVEALSYGIPCLVTEGTNMAETIEKNKAGWGCDTTAEAISKALGEIFENNTELQSYGNAAYSLAGRYDWKYLAGESSRQYRNLIG